MGRKGISDQPRKVIKPNSHICYNVNVMRQSVCSVINRIKVNKFAVLFDRRRWTRRQSKAIQFSLCESELLCALIGSVGLN